MESIRTLRWSLKAFDDYIYWQNTDRKILNRINKLIKDVLRNPFTGIGKPEPLKGDLSRLWSGRITDEHRLVYLAENQDILIMSCRYHYEK